MLYILFEKCKIVISSIYFKDSLFVSNHASKVKTKHNITEHKQK